MVERLILEKIVHRILEGLNDDAGPNLDAFLSLIRQSSLRFIACLATLLSE